MKPQILRFTAVTIVAAAIVTAAILLLAPSSQPPAPTLTLIADTITDTSTGQPIQANVYVNDTLTFQGVTHFQMVVPLDGSTEIRVVAPGYHAWGLRPKGGGSDKVLQGPVKLKPK